MDEELKKKLLQKSNLVTSKTYQDIRLEQLNAIVKLSLSATSSEHLRGMLMQIAETDKWQSQYESAVKKAKQNKEE